MNNILHNNVYINGLTHKRNIKNKAVLNVPCYFKRKRVTDGKINFTLVRYHISHRINSDNDLIAQKA